MLLRQQRPDEDAASVVPGNRMYNVQELETVPLQDCFGEFRIGVHKLSELTEVRTMFLCVCVCVIFWLLSLSISTRRQYL